jgi:hypothetical protein
MAKLVGTFRVWFYETWYKASTDDNMRRCNCWHWMAGTDGYVTDNGWVSASKPYPHAEYCKNADR